MLINKAKYLQKAFMVLIMMFLLTSQSFMLSAATTQNISQFNALNALVTTTTLDNCNTLPSINTEFQVNTISTGGQSFEDISALPNGGYVVTWNFFDSSIFGVKAQILDSFGNKVGNEFQVNTSEVGSQYYSAVSTLSNNNIVFTWEDTNALDGSFSGIFARIFSSTGTPLTNEIAVNTHTQFQQSAPVIATIANDKFVIVWMSNEQDGDNYGIFGQIFNSDGSKFGTEFLVNDITVGTQQRPEIAPLSNNGFLVMWDGNGQGDTSGIFAKIYDGNGGVIKNEFRVNSSTANGQEQANATSFNDGSFVIAWNDSPVGGRSQYFNSDGNAIGTEIDLKIDGGLVPRVASLPNNNFFVVWQKDTDTKAQIFSNTGTKAGFEFRVNNLTEGFQSNAKVISLTNGDIAISWTDDNHDGSQNGVFSRIIHYCNGNNGGSTECETDLQVAQQQIEFLQSQVNSLTQDNQSLSQQNSQLQNQLSTANQMIATLNDQINILQNQISNLTQQNDMLQNEVTMLASQIDQLQSQLTQLQNSVTQLQTQLNTANQTIQDQQLQLTELQDQLDTANQMLATCQTQLLQVQDELNKLISPKEQISTAKQQIQALLATAPNNAQSNLNNSLKDLTNAQLSLAVGNLERGLREIRSANQDLINAANKGVNTTNLQQILVQGVAVRVTKAVNDVEALLGSSNQKVQEAKALLQQGQNLLAQGNFKNALDAFIDALQKADSAKP